MFHEGMLMKTAVMKKKIGALTTLNIQKLLECQLIL